MAERRHIRGITWDHPRGYDCLAANVPAFEAAHPDIQVTWERRSLKNFGEQPIDALAEQYDLIVVDHPWVGHGRASGCLADLRPIIGDAFLNGLLGDSVGRSSESYHWEGGVYGLPTDAAAQVASYRPDLLAAVDLPPPRTHRDVLALADAAKRRGLAIATPACPTDAMCLIYTFSANLGHPFADGAESFIARDVLLEAFGLTEELVGAGDPRALGWNPIQTYDAMSSEDALVYCAYAFGYSNYARRGAAKRLAFTNVAGPGVDPVAGAMLGGAGCSVTRSARDHEAIAAYLAFVHDPAHQRGAYFEAGGQPGSRSAWTDERINAETDGFFRNTLDTLDKSYLRPRFDGYVPFFEEGGVVVNRRLRGEITREAAADELHRLYRHARGTA